MKMLDILPIGAALLMAVPLAAQTSEGGTPRTPQTPATPKQTRVRTEIRVKKDSKDAPEARGEKVYRYEIEAAEAPEAPIPPDAPVPPDAPDGEIIQDVIIENGDVNLEGKDILVESPDAIRNIKIDSLRNQVRIQITKSAKESAELRRNVEKLERNLRARMREFKRLQLMDKDTAELSKALEEARRALDSAQFSVLRLDSNIICIRSFGANGNVDFSKFETSFENFGKQFENFGAQFEKYGEEMGRHFEKLQMDSLGNRFMTRNFMVMVDSGSGSANIHWMSGSPDASFMQQMRVQISDSMGDHQQRIIVMNRMGREDSVAGIDPHRLSCRGTNAVTVIEGKDLGDDPLLLLNNRLVVGRDSLRIVDGKDQQMTIRIDRDASNDGRTRVIVVTMSRGKKEEPATQVETPEDLKKNGITLTPSSGYSLEANTPNPFSESTTISFTLPKPEHVSLTVFDANGNTVKVLKDEDLPAGTHTASFDASGLASGIYLYRLVAGGFSETKTMTIAK